MSTNLRGGGVSPANQIFTVTEKTKLATVATGAEVNVNADWNSGSGDAQILNKPIIPDELADLTEDATHRTVTDTEISTWNSKENAGVAAGLIVAHEAASDPHTGYQKESEKAAASGYPSLNLSSLVVQDPANVQTTPAADKIPRAESSSQYISVDWMRVFRNFNDSGGSKNGLVPAPPTADYNPKRVFHEDRTWSVVPGAYITMVADGGIISWSSFPVASTEFLGVTRHRTKIELTPFYQARLVANVVTGLSGALLSFEVSTDGTTWNTLGRDDPTISLTTAGCIVGPWSGLESTVESFLRLVGSGGDGAGTVDFGSIFIQFR